MYNSRMFSNPLLAIYVLSAIVVIFAIWTIRLEVKMHRLLKGKNAKSLEDTILQTVESIKHIKEFQKEAVNYFENIEERLSRSIQSVETIRFNPFKGNGDGGNQSFSTSFVDEKGDGVVISSLYSRDRISIFSKPLEKFGSTFELTDEEKEVIGTSKQNLSK